MTLMERPITRARPRSLLAMSLLETIVAIGYGWIPHRFIFRSLVNAVSTAS
jgi:hypothetical protein